MSSLKLRKNDEVLVRKGKDKGKVGHILEIVRPKKTEPKATLKLLVKGVNIIKRHQKPNNNNQEGGIISKEAPIPFANVAYVVSKTKDKVVTSRIGFVEENGKKYRFIKKTKKVLRD